MTYQEIITKLVFLARVNELLPEVKVTVIISHKVTAAPVKVNDTQVDAFLGVQLFEDGECVLDEM